MASRSAGSRSRLPRMFRTALLAIIVACGPAAPAPKPAAPQQPPPAEPSEPVGMPAGYLEMHAWKDIFIGEQAALLLVDDPPQRVLPIFIGGTEGQSIYGRMNHQPPVRPLTHD